MDNYVNVEMDPEAEVEVRAVIQKQNMTVVGWWVTESPPSPPRAGRHARRVTGTTATRTSSTSRPRWTVSAALLYALHWRSQADICAVENQHNYQTLFQLRPGLQPFIGAIICAAHLPRRRCGAR